MIETYLGKPTTRPDLTMTKNPVFTTWNFYFRHINQTVILDYARQIADHNYTASQIEIDDLWVNLLLRLEFFRIFYILLKKNEHIRNTSTAI